jgi:hypothetical protein
MNEDEHGITPFDVTAITVEPHSAGGHHVTIEQGNGDVIKTIILTEMERVQLAMMLCSEPGQGVRITSCEFVDFERHARE